MNTLGIQLTWGAVQITLLTAVAAILYLLAARRRPELGSATAALAVVVSIGLTLLAVCPLPAWWTWDRAASPGNVAEAVEAETVDRGTSELASSPSAASD